MVATVPQIEVDNVTVVNSQQGGSATKLAAFLAELKQTTGIDLAETIETMSHNHSPSPAISPILPKSLKSVPQNSSEPGSET